MAASTSQIRYMHNNFINSAAITDGRVTFSSFKTGFPGINAADQRRTKLWITGGNFEITTANQELYINDGANKTVSITAGSYNGPTALASQIQTDLNAASSNWTVAYSATTNKFTISNTGSVTLRFSVTTNAIWSTLGYTLSSDSTGTSFVAQEPRIHTREWVKLDRGAALQSSFTALIAPIDESLIISDDADEIKIQFNNVDDWASPPLEVDITRDPRGLFSFYDDAADTVYRYQRLTWVDKRNPAGSEGFRISNVYMGDHITMTATNLQRGFQFQQVDSSTVFRSDSGVKYFNEKPQFYRTSGSVVALSRSERIELEQMFYEVGIFNSFYLSIDPKLCLSNKLSEFTKYVNFTSKPQLSHLVFDRFNMSLNIEEAI